MDSTESTTIQPPMDSTESATDAAIDVTPTNSLEPTNSSGSISNSAAARRERAERRRVAKRSSAEKATPKKLGAVKLGTSKATPVNVMEKETNLVSHEAAPEEHLDSVPVTSEEVSLSGAMSSTSITSVDINNITTAVKSEGDTIASVDKVPDAPEEVSKLPEKVPDATEDVLDIVEKEPASRDILSRVEVDASHNVVEETLKYSRFSSAAEAGVQLGAHAPIEQASQIDLSGDQPLNTSQNPFVTAHYLQNSAHESLDTTSKSVDSDIVLVNHATADRLTPADAVEAVNRSEESSDDEPAVSQHEEGGAQSIEPAKFTRSDLVAVEPLSPPIEIPGAHEEESPVRTGSDATLVNTASTSQLTTVSGSSEGTMVDELPSPRDASSAAMTDSIAMDQSTCSDNSYVKCELPVSSNMADSVGEYQRRAPSEFSDFETATSSDIEIISMASTYGDGNGEARMMDFVPLSRSVFKTRIRNISPDDEMPVSSPQFSPGSDKDSSGQSEQSTGQSEARKAENSVNSDMIKKVSQLTEVLEARENKLLSISREQSELLEVNAHLKRRIEQMEETNGDLNLVKSEFGQRLHDVERKLQNALREKELVKKQYLSAQEELHNRIGTSGKMQKIVEEKDEQISSLLAEGEKLTKQQLASNNLIKKLRKKEKDVDELNRDQSHKIETLNAELERLKGVLDSKIQNEVKHTELIKQLNSAVSNYQAETSKLKTEAEEALEKQRRAESAVDNSYKEIAELHKSLAAKDADIKELKLGNEVHLKEELQQALDRKQKEALRDADHLTGQIEDMQLSMSRMEKEQHRREECLRQEKQDLLDRLEEADKRNDELTQSVTSATKPLLRQIENLQSSYSTQSMSWERVEKSLTERLAEMQGRLATSSEKERQASDSSIELSSHVSILESQLSSLKQEKSKLMAEVEVSKMKISTLQDERNSAVTQLETYKANMESDTMEVRKANTLLENKLELEKTMLEAERKKCATLLEQLNEKEQQIQELNASHLSSTPSPSFMQDESKPLTARRSLKQDELLERALTSSTMTGSSLYDSMRNHSTTSLFESLESQVKQREGEIVQLQADIAEHEKTRESLTKEMVKLTEENGKQEMKLRELSRLQQQYKELNGRYQALLQMYGEKEEEVTELRLDLIDVKQMYKQQIDALLSK
ncbi:TATA element modulatory factor-like isoform X2 [Watersipora subatra]|uniref:TATA element modulatory factor-like isoform X2 n=1 Tax=Watersipora subatra TaxID=2589382 RepID=UPI00355B82D1